MVIPGNRLHVIQSISIMLGGVSRCKSFSVEVISRTDQFPTCSLLSECEGWLEEASFRKREWTASNSVSILSFFLFLLPFGVVYSWSRIQERYSIKPWIRHNFIREVPKQCFCLTRKRIILVGSFQFDWIQVHDYARDIVPEAICVLTGDKLIITSLAKPVHREAVNIVKLQ